jgi:hypothetical protein
VTRVANNHDLPLWPSQARSRPTRATPAESTAFVFHSLIRTGIAEWWQWNQGVGDGRVVTSQAERRVPGGLPALRVAEPPCQARASDWTAGHLPPHLLRSADLPSGWRLTAGAHGWRSLRADLPPTSRSTSTRSVRTSVHLPLLAPGEIFRLGLLPESWVHSP